MSLVLDEVLPAPVALDWPRRRTAALASTRLSDAELRELAHRFDDAPADEIVRWAAARFGHRLTLAASMADAVLIDVASRVMPGIEVIFLDTQYHFQETLATAERIRDRYPIRLRVVWPEARPDDLWRTDPDTCCHARKVAPMARALHGRAAWLSGLRRADSAHRNEVSAVHRDSRGLVKINPLIGWSDDDVTRYIAEHDVPVNPLVAQGYTSIGCWPCTRPVRTGEDARAGRWDGSGKTECGLHL